MSLKQLVKIKRVRSLIFQKTERARIRKTRSQTRSKETFYSRIQRNKIRKAAKSDTSILGAPRVTVIVAGCMKGEGLLDPGSPGSIISQRLEEELKLEVIPTRDFYDNKLADG